MPTGIRFRDGRIIDFQGTPWTIEVDEAEETVTFTHSEEDTDLTFRSDGMIEPDEAFEFASAVLFEGTEWEIDADEGQLKFDHNGTTFYFDEEGNFQVPTAFQVAQDVVLEEALAFEDTDWVFEVDDENDTLVAKHEGEGVEFGFTSDGKLDVPEVFDWGDEDVEFETITAGKPTVETLEDLPDAEDYPLGTEFFVEEENQSYEVTQDE